MRSVPVAIVVSVLVMFGSACSRPAAAPADGGQPKTDALSASETRLLEMYDELSAAFSVEHDECEQMGDKLSQLARSYEGDAQRWTEEQSKLSEPEKQASAARLARVAGPRMERARSLIQKAMATCAQSQRFQEGLQKLAVLSPTS